MSAIPVPYIASIGGQQQILGHYSVVQRSGEIAATLGAAAHLARIRWAPTLSNTYLVLMRLKVGISVSTAVNVAVEMTMRAIIARQFSVDFTTNMTQINMATVKATNAMRSTGSLGMGNSLMGSAGPGTLTTAALSGQTMTVDNAPFAITPIPTLVGTNSTGTVTIVPIGFTSPMITLYEWTGLGQHPVVLAANEGVIVQSHLAGPASGAFGLYTQWEWAEVYAF